MYTAPHFAVAFSFAFRDETSNTSSRNPFLIFLAGVARDWAKAEAKVKFVYTVELASRGSGFVAPIRSIIPSGEENWAALTVVADTIIEKCNQDFIYCKIY